ncbi:hypothetical protein HYU96_04155 [Candidatus Daviesbacteria bacterium]|nr:hypothetical protein [Candidatus Daviesbacteria bacterium]
MDLLQIALIFLILLLASFLTFTGIQVFFILRDLHLALKRLNKVLETGGEIAEDIEKPVSVASKLISALGKRIHSKPKPKRFYKKVL